jgi:epoxyqueuosine reductase
VDLRGRCFRMAAHNLVLEARSNTVKEISKRFGFLDCRIAKATALEEDARNLEQWLKNGFHGDMGYMSDHFEKRIDPRILVPGAKSVIVFSQNYYPSIVIPKESYQISKYAYGRDYHKVIKKKLKAFMAELNEIFGPINGRGFVDSAPVMEKSWAKKSGLGWMGKHSNVLSKQKGSFFFLAVLIVDLDLDSDDQSKDLCGTCTACIDACPTDAIIQPYLVDGSKCISYFTIELKDAKLPDQFKGKFNDWIFGCDICQDVCPWNRFSKPHQESDFHPKDQLLKMDRKDWEELEFETFNELFTGSAVKRTGYEGLKRNIKFLPNV